MALGPWGTALASIAPGAKILNRGLKSTADIKLTTPVLGAPGSTYGTQPIQPGIGAPDPNHINTGNGITGWQQADGSIIKNHWASEIAGHNTLHPELYGHALYAPGAAPGVPDPRGGGGFTSPTLPATHPGGYTASVLPTAGAAQPQTFTAMAQAHGLVPLATPPAANAAPPLSVPNNSTNGDNPFLRPGNGYGGRKPSHDGGISNDPQNWYDTPDSRDYGEKNPEGEFYTFLTNQGAEGQDNFSKWARSLYPQIRAAYDAAVMRNPELHFRDYLKTINGTLQNLYAGLTPDQRGVGIPTQTKTIYLG